MKLFQILEALVPDLQPKQCKVQLLALSAVIALTASCAALVPPRPHASSLHFGIEGIDVAGVGDGVLDIISASLGWGFEDMGLMGLVGADLGGLSDSSDFEFVHSNTDSVNPSSMGLNAGIQFSPFAVTDPFRPFIGTGFSWVSLDIYDRPWGSSGVDLGDYGEVGFSIHGITLSWRRVSGMSMDFGDGFESDVVLTQLLLGYSSGF